MVNKDDSKNEKKELEKETMTEEVKEEKVEEKISDESNEKSKRKGLIIKIIVAVIILILALVLGKFLFDKLKKNDSVSGIRGLLKTKYESIQCIDSGCNGFIVIDGDKLSKYKVMLYNVDGKKVADYKVNYDSTNKTTEVPIEIWDKYYISTTVNISKFDIEKYSIRNKNGKIIYETENKLEVLNDSFVKMTDIDSTEDKYSIIDKKGKEVYSGITDINSYLNGEYIQIEINDTYAILNSDGDKILDGYKIAKLVTDESGDALFAIVKNTKDSVYNYYSLDKKQVIGDSFSSYVQSDEDYEFIITKKENDKSVKYILHKNGKQEKFEEDLDSIVEEIEESINKDEYTLYDGSVYEKNQKEVLVDSKKDKSFGVLNIKDNKYTKLYDYRSDRSYFYSTVSKLDSDDEQYLKITCSTYTCDSKKSIIYDIKENKVVYTVEGTLTISLYIGYDDGYKVIKFSGESSDKYNGKYVIFDNENKELYVSENNVIIIDKDVIVGKKQSYSLSLYSVKESKVLNDEKVSSVTFGDKVLYKYTDDNNNTIILNDKGEEVLKAKDDNYLKQANDSYIYLEDNLITIYNVIKDKTYKYELKENEKINDASGDIISPFKDVMFINNSTDKYVKVVNFKGKQIKKLKKVEISDVEINTKEDKAFIIVKKNSEKGDKYGLYVAE